MSPVKKQNPKKKWNWKITAAALLAGSVLGTLAVLVHDKYRMREMVCQVVGIDAENGVIGARCMIR